MNYTIRPVVYMGLCCLDLKGEAWHFSSCFYAKLCWGACPFRIDTKIIKRLGEPYPPSHRAAPHPPPSRPQKQTRDMLAIILPF